MRGDRGWRECERGQGLECERRQGWRKCERGQGLECERGQGMEGV